MPSAANACMTQEFIYNDLGASGIPAIASIAGGGGGGAVTSVFGRTGAVIAVSGDYTAAQVTNAMDKTAANTMASGGTIDASGETGSNALRVPVKASVVTTSNGAVGYDSTNNNFHGGNSGADSIIPVTTNATPTNNNCVKWVVSSGQLKLDDAGSCASSSGGGIVTYSGPSLTFTGTQYFPVGGGASSSTTEANVDADSPSAATITNFYAQLSAAPGVGNSVAF